MARTYDRGDAVRLEVQFYDIDGNPANPDTVTLRVRPPENGALMTYTTADLTLDGTGHYYRDVSVETAGTWYYRFEGTGNVQSAGEGSFIVRPSQVIS